MTKDINLENALVMFGDAMQRFKELPNNAVDSIVTDPPYGLSDNKYVAETITKWINGERDFIPDGKGFMGKAWDAFVPPPAIWDECLRVLKPGGHLLAFFGTRTQDIGALAIRLAGFEIRDSVAWLYGSGFPKSMDISKAIDKQAGAERKVVGKDKSGKSSRAFQSLEETTAGEYNITAPATDAAKQYDGWGTALKPAHEPIVVARKPISESTVANNVLLWGTGGLNIDASRVGNENRINPPVGDLSSIGSSRTKPIGEGTSVSGRFPANLILSHSEDCVEISEGASISTPAEEVSGGIWHKSTGKPAGPTYSDVAPVYHCVPGCPVAELDKQSDGSSRFFYVAKASKKDRNEGMTDTNNSHPTVKPTALMEYLVKLVTPEGGTVLDPFTGSGSTGKAALLNGFKFIGCELTEDYLPIIEGRLRFAEDNRHKPSSANAGKKRKAKVKTKPVEQPGLFEVKEDEA